MTPQRHRFLKAALGVVLALAAAALGFAAFSQEEEAREAGRAERAPTGDRQHATAATSGGRRAAVPHLRTELAAGAELDRSAQAELAAAARRFATTLAGWLYGDRREIDVEPFTPQLRAELATAPPYIPADQIGSADGRAMHVQVSVQTHRSGVLVVTIWDSRTSYPIPARFELRAGRWQVVHLNTH